jgi:hypothetical protein
MNRNGARKVIVVLLGAAVWWVGTITPASATATAGRQTFSGYETGNQTNFNGFISSLNVAHGVINAFGHDVAVKPPDPPPPYDLDDFVFPDGTLHTQVSSDSPASIDPRTCFGQGPLTGSITVIGGTGRYVGAKGTFTISGTLILIAGLDHAKCSDNVTFTAIFTAKGTITLPGS